MRFVDLSERDATQDLKGRGSRNGECAVRTFDGAVSIVQTTAKHLFYAERFKPYAGKNNVGDAVKGSDFVEMDGLWRLAVDFALGHCDAVKDRDGPFLHEVGQLTAFDHRADFGVGTAFLVMVVMAVFMLMLVIMVMIVMTMFVIVFLMIMIARVLMLVLVLMLMGMSVFVAMLIFVLVLMRMRVAVFVRMAVFLFLIVVVMMVSAAVSVGMLLVRGAAVNVEFHALDVLPLGAVVVHVEITEIQFAQLPLERAGFHAKVD